MEITTVSKIVISGGKSQTYYIITKWEKDLKICLVRNEEYWKGTFLADNFSHYYEHLDVNEEKYLIYLKEALGSNPCDPKYIFNFDNNVFKWKVMDDCNISLIYGKCELKEYFNNGGCELVADTLLKLNRCCEDKLRNQENETLELGRQLRHCIDNYKKLSELKQEMEEDLYVKFIELLNAKKQKISELQQFFFKVNPDEGPRISSDSVQIKLLDSAREKSNIHQMSDTDSED